MKRSILIGALLLAGVIFVQPTIAAAYNYGDFRSETLVSKAWGALAEGDLEAVLAYTNKCVELYAEQAQKMQSSLSDYPEGDKDEIFSYWALNDIATSLFIQGEAYRKAQQKQEALEAYKKVASDYSYGQAWDTNGWFWKPVEAAKEKIAMIESGSDLDFGNYSSSFLTSQAWKALQADDVNSVIVYTDKVLELYGKEAKTMQESMTEYAWESKGDIFSKWALNDVGTSLFIKGEALRKAGESKKAQEAYKTLVDQYFYAQCWDPNGWFWKPAEAAQQALDDLGVI
ncbi:MAG: tetratricopeptide repeat protein [Candidatus Omnitrophica bacterium]|nr:tetratricopeptide repeat protein [Candidatus Omnitrophota bacterium]